MPIKDRNDPDEVTRRSRATKDDADQGIGVPERGIRLPLTDNGGDDHASFPGVDEPVVPPDERGTPAPSTRLPSED